MDKFEKHIRQKLEEREIKPSRKAWQRVEASLNSEPAIPRSKNYHYAIAAAMVGIIISVVFFSTTAPKPVAPKIVDVKTNSTRPMVSDENELSRNDIEPMNDENEAQKNINHQMVEELQLQIASTNSLMVDKSLEKVVSETQDVEKQKSLIDHKVDEVFAQVNLLKSKNQVVSEKEVDSLLRAAQHQILKEKLFQQNRTVDAMALLTEVEGELDQSFRNQIFEALKEGYSKLKTAVADRNN